MGPLTKEVMKRALNRLDELIGEQTTLIMGGGGAMILAHGFPKGTTDIDAVPKGKDPSSLEKWVKQIAEEQKIPHDWLNPYFSTFVHCLPSDYGQRLIEVFKGSKLSVQALGLEEMLLMKCFAHRQKDIPHAKALLIAGADIGFVEARIEELLKKRIPKSQEALDFLQDVRVLIDS